MLVITRKAGEAVMLNDDIEITVVSVEGSQIRLGFSAPPSIAIYRKEIYERILRANREAAVHKKSVRLPRLPDDQGPPRPVS